jgi:hypothetical protein
MTVAPTIGFAKCPIVSRIALTNIGIQTFSSKIARFVAIEKRAIRTIIWTITLTTPISILSRNILWRAGTLTKRTKITTEVSMLSVRSIFAKLAFCTIKAFTFIWADTNARSRTRELA